MLEREAKKAKPCRHPDGAQQAEHLKPSDCMKLESHSKSRSAALSTVGASLILPSALLVIMAMVPVARARDFSSSTVIPRERYPGVKMQQGRPQSDNDRKPDFGGSLKSLGQPRVDIQQGQSLPTGTGSMLKNAGRTRYCFVGLIAGNDARLRRSRLRR
jgi:hypothetical protein